MKCFVVAVVVGLIGFGNAEPPAQNQGWGQQQQQVPQDWGQQQPAPQAQGWGQAPVAQGWGQQQQPQQGGWGQGQSGGGKGGKGKGLDWEYNFALGYQGEKGKGQGGGGGGDGWGATPAPASGGWSSEPETNIKKPSFGDIFSAIISFPREVKNWIKESGLWILFVPLLVIIPLFIFAYSAGKFFGGMDEGWGWDKRSAGSKPWLETEWDSLKGFINDPQVQRAAKGWFMDEFMASRILSSVSEEVNLVKEGKEVKVKASKANKLP